MEEYYRVQADIDLDAIKKNYRVFRNYVGMPSDICAVIKADGYGHGARQIANVLMEEGVDRFAVANPEEAFQLRRYGVDGRLMIFGFAHAKDYEAIINQDIVQTVFKESMAIGLSEAASRLGKIAVIHINVDTGMSRLGFSADDDGVAVIERITKLPGLKIEGIYTHFARADESDLSDSREQVERFKQFLKKLEDKGIQMPLIHMANSAGTMGLPQSHKSFVRIGISSYGLYPSNEVDKSAVSLTPVLSLKSHIILLKEIEAGQAVSYGGTFIADQRMKVATIPVGYGDGYPRSLSGKGRVIIRGHYAPIIGRVCMDLFMVDVSHIDGVTDGDTVTLIGRDGDCEVSADEIAELTGTINYEVTCQLGKRIPRVYHMDGKVTEVVDYLS